MKTKKYLLLIVMSISVLIAYSQTTDDMINACLQGDLAGVKNAVESGVDVNTANADGATAISVAYLWPEITKYLIEKGADVNSGMVPALIGASSHHSVDVVKILLDAGADPNKNGFSDPAAFFKRKYKEEKAKGDKANEAMVKLYKDMIDKAGDNVPIYALQNLLMGTNCSKILQMLIDKGMKMEIPGGLTALQLWSTYGQTSYARKINWSKADYSSFGMKLPEWTTNISDEVNSPYVDMLNIILQHNKGVNTPDANGYPPLYHILKRAASSASDQREVATGIKALINAGADITIENVNKEEVISLAASIDDPELLKMIIDKGADVNVSFKRIDDESGMYLKGFTPLIIATMYNCQENIKVLMDEGAKPGKGVHGLGGDLADPGCILYIKDKNAIFYAVETANLDLVKYLVEQKKSWGWMEKKQPTAKSESSYTGGGVKVTTTYIRCKGYKKAITPSKHASMLGHEEIATFLKSKKL